MKVSRHTKWMGLVLLSIFLCPPAGAQEYRIAIVDLGKVFGNYHRFATEKTNLESELKKRIDERKTLDLELQDKLNQLQAMSVTGSETKKEELRKEIEKLRIDRIKANSDIEIDMKSMENEITKTLMKGIEIAIRTIGVREGYAAILDKTAVLFFKPEYDITDLVIKELNKDAAQPQ